jgi:crotonobetainyl-CoA:carnitine CoA-transferase CaiB-like acyl-CoA transferase
MEAHMARPLEGIRIIDLTAYLSGPFATMNLAALGAEVIKIERPGIGDPCRWNPPFAGPHEISTERRDDTDMSLLYLKRNRNKKSIFLDLRNEKGKAILRRLVEKGDVFIENFTPGVIERLGFDYQAVKQINPRVIYCSISGYGQDGPYRDFSAFDPTIQATSGLMSLTGFPDGPPLKCGAIIGDMIPALYAVIGILSTLMAREQTGKGDRIDLSMQDACFSLATDEAMDINLAWGLPTRSGNRLQRLAPWNSYEAKDGYIMICVANNNQWAGFLDAMGRADLKGDPRFEDQQGRFKNSDEVEALVNDWLKPLTKEEALSRLRDNKVPSGNIAGFDEVLEDPQLNFRGMVKDVVHPVSGKTGAKAAGFPIRYSNLDAKLDKPAPYPGGNSEEVYTDLLGLSEKELEDLKKEGVI